MLGYPWWVPCLVRENRSEFCEVGIRWNTAMIITSLFLWDLKLVIEEHRGLHGSWSALIYLSNGSPPWPSILRLPVGLNLAVHGPQCGLPECKPLSAVWIHLRQIEAAGKSR